MAVIVVGAFCYVAGWTERARSPAIGAAVGACSILVLHDAFACAVGTVIVGVLCTLAGYFDRRR